MEKKHIKLTILCFIVLLIVLLGVSLAFFNYTRTGTANNVRTGRIYFNTSEGTSLNITNLFPMTSTDANNSNLDSLTIGIVGDTNYVDGEEFEISITDVTNTINGKSIPLNFIASYTATSGGNIGESSDTYWDDRNNMDANIYKLTTNGKVENGKDILVGYIKSGNTGISGTLTIKAYIDSDRIVISDTYNGPSSTPSDNMGTTSEWVDGRVVLTTTEWNSIANNPISFKIKTESNAGLWVGKIDTCEGCKFMFPVLDELMYTTWNTRNVTPTIISVDLYDNYHDVIDLTGKDYFIGVKTNNSNQATNVYVCGVMGDVSFCLKESQDGLYYQSNKELLQRLWNNTCVSSITSNTAEQTTFEKTECERLAPGMIDAGVFADGYAYVEDEANNYAGCDLDKRGMYGCWE